MKRAETDVAAPIVQWLSSNGWEVFQEVAPGFGYPRADIVGRLGKLIWIIEVKTSLSLDVIAQAIYWKGMAHGVLVGVPWARKSRARSLAEDVCKAHGIGVIEVHGSAAMLGLGDSRAQLTVCPALNRTMLSVWVAKALCEEQKTWAEAGNATCSYYSPFRRTCENARGYVETHPGCTMKELMSAIQHHYSSEASGRQALSKWLREGKVKGLEARLEGNKLRVYATGGKREGGS